MTSYPRFSDNPFRDPNMPPEQAAYLDRRNAAINHWHKTGDPIPAREFRFNLPDRRQGSPTTKPIKIVNETTTFEELINAHHSGESIVFNYADPELQKSAGLFCPGCGQWMDAEFRMED